MAVPGEKPMTVDISRAGTEANERDHCSVPSSPEKRWGGPPAAGEGGSVGRPDRMDAQDPRRRTGGVFASAGNSYEM